MLASRLLTPEAAQLFLPPMSADLKHEEAWEIMINLKQKILAMAILGIVSTGTFAQKKGDDKRPPKQPNTVVATPKEKPPQGKNQGDKNRGDKRGKP